MKQEKLNNKQISALIFITIILSVASSHFLTNNLNTLSSISEEKSVSSIFEEKLVEHGNVSLSSSSFTKSLSVSSLNPLKLNGNDDKDEDDGNEEEKDEDNDGVDDEEEHINEREVSVEVEEDEASIESKQKFGEVKNEFETQLDVSGDGMILSFDFKSETDETESDLSFELTVSEIIEYRELSSDDFYNESLDELVQTYAIEEFNSLAYSIENIANSSVYVISSSTKDGIFSFSLYLSSEFFPINETILAPTEIKIDFRINNFNYEEDDSNLALKIKVEAEAELETDEKTEDEKENRASNEKEIEISTGDFTGFFSWSELVLVDDQEMNVTASKIKEIEGANIFYLNYPRGNEIIHDPKIGIANVLEKPGTNGTEPTNPTSPIEPPFFSNFNLSANISLPEISALEYLLVTIVATGIAVPLILISRRNKK